MLVTGLMVLFAVMRGSHSVGVCGQFMKLSSSLM